MPSSPSAVAIALRRVEERDRVFPHAAKQVWNRKNRANKGFTTVPRVMPIICAIMDALCKGAPPSAVYADLWYKVYDEMYLTVESPQERAFFSGFGGQRAVTTWSMRMRKLAELGFIETKPGTRGEFHHVLIRNPELTIAALEKKYRPKRAPEDELIRLFDVYHQRRREVGAE